MPVAAADALRCWHDRPALAWPTRAGHETVLGVICHGGATDEAQAAPEPLWPPYPVPERWQVHGPVRQGRLGCVRYRSNGVWVFGTARADDRSPGGMEAAAWRAYADLFRVLEREGCAHLQRLWNYLPDIHGLDDGLERYRRFNLGRARAFAEAGRGLGAGAPAACAMGTRTGPLTVHFLAGRQPARAIENPRQVSAYHYPRRYGPCSPTFSRAALADLGGGVRVLFISGTASIVGHESVHLGDVAAQTAECLRNIDAVLGVAREHLASSWSLEALRGRLECTVYVRRPADLDLVRAVVTSHLGATSPAAQAATYLRADVCRAELLVEIEAQLALGG
ncbi:MAG: hypothetical protein ACK4ZD_00855 [Caldimonas sp.]|uniref:chorismate transformation enzyme, FkbO/Hyg5 family n=1 Tax=Caldimonas sp. TaxID=2838790 RepID=UPI00391D458A